jgi:hypothetical protein
MPLGKPLPLGEHHFMAANKGAVRASRLTLRAFVPDSFAHMCVL